MTRWLFVCGLVGCGLRPVPDVVPGEVAGFPHVADYRDARHGVDAVAADATCWRCHGLDEGTVSSGPACRSCHDYPHAPDAGTTAAHGAAYALPGQECASCHGADGARAPAEVEAARCVACHATYPHAPGFERAQGHGAATLAHGGTTACATCHGGPQGLSGPDQCGSCHAVWPHAEGFLLGHGAAWRADAASCGEVCHTHTEATAPPSCVRCHASFPHPAGWVTGHVVTVQREGDVACVRCHAPGSLVGPALPDASCGTGCHGSAP